MVYDLMLPKALRAGKSSQPEGESQWRITELGKQKALNDFNNAKAKQALLSGLQESQVLNKAQAQKLAKSWRPIFKGFLKDGLLTQESGEPALPEIDGSAEPMQLTSGQANICKQVAADSEGYSTHLIYGVTGSGKTEVYLSIIERFLNEGKQALILVPEIGLTPQLIDRVRSRLKARVAAVHSQLSEKERHIAWWQAKHHKVDVILGTRSAVFTPFKALGIIVVDEEHDLSFKQQDGVRYHARDVALVAAKNANIPVVMGSATPALESLANVESGRFHYGELTERATGMEMPDIKLIDLEACRGDGDLKRYGLAPRLVQEIKARIDRKEQSLLYINRRGFSPTVYCPECADIPKCQRCHAHLTMHRATQHSMDLRCHHCGYEERRPRECQECHKADVLPVGFGTQRIEDGLEELFPNAKFLRVDRDALSGKGELDKALSEIRDGDVDIIVGTQLLTKGHDFPNVTLVGVLDADRGLFSNDFRSSERFYQQVLQVSGRAGRHKAGEVYIQTQFPHDPIFGHLQKHDYRQFAQATMQERRDFEYPPIAYMALLRAESVYSNDGLQFLGWVAANSPRYEGVMMSDPVPAPMEKMAGRYRAQLMIKSTNRGALHQTLSEIIDVITANSMSKKVRWSLDVDPVDMY